MSKDIIKIIDQLLYRKIGDPYRLEHIKQSYLKNNKCWESDTKYIEKLKEAHLVEKEEPKLENTNFENPGRDYLHCWKCGMKNSNKGNFCINCGVSLFDVGSKAPTKFKLVPETTPTKTSRKIPKIIPIIIGILIISAIAAIYILQSDITPKDTLPVIKDGIVDSRCGQGTVFVESQNTCVIGVAPTESSSKCGVGTIYDKTTNSCIKS